jgi:BlaI family penicillinase repressor
MGISMKKKVSLTDSEWQIMQLLWKNAPLTITQIEKELKDKTGWSKHSIISFLKRMLTKGVITVEETGKAIQFYPAAEQEETYIEETKSFLSKLYGGSIGLMMSSMVDRAELNEEEIEELIDILNKSKKGE